MKVAAKLALFMSISAATANFNPFPFSPGFDIQKVTAQAESIPSHSWEFGTASEALLELYDPQWSVFGLSPFPVPTLQPNDVQSLAYAASKIVIGTGANALSNGDGAVGDPASLGVSAVLLGKTNQTFADAATATEQFITNVAPRFWNGAISQRVDVPELWSDFMYMAPPFLAYYAVDTNNATLLREVVRQCRLYRQVLKDNNTAPYNGVWEHIIGPQSYEPSLWSTGNGWAAAGMARVLASVIKAPFFISWRDQAVNELSDYIKEILDGARNAPLDDQLLRNRLNDTTGDGHGYGEISGTMMLSAVAYRMAVMQPWKFGQQYIDWADNFRITIGGNDTAGNPHVTSSGIVTPAVNPLNWFDTAPFTSGSPEGQCFTVLMYAAWRDCVLIGICRQHHHRRREIHRRL